MKLNFSEAVKKYIKEKGNIISIELVAAKNC